MQGSQEELEGKLQSLYGYQKDQAKKEIDKFIKNNRSGIYCTPLRQRQS
jgi:uncharacterized protein YjbJ (UPF0337 family)